MFQKAISVLVLLSVSCYASSEQQHHNLTINTCRTLPSGDIQILGNSETDNQNRSIMFSGSGFQEKVIDRYLSLCLTSLASGSKLRIDYLDCTGTSCATTGNTSLNIYK